jgi:hypothetical protein
MSNLSYQILPNTDDGTHEVRLFVDGIDWIEAGHLGLDPPDLVRELTGENRSHLTIGRCGCGVLGCDDIVVDVQRTSHSVEWSYIKRRSAIFDAAHFYSVVAALVEDHSWEPVGRTVERHLDEMFAGMMTGDGYVFDWSSTRIRPDHVSISVSKGGGQKLLERSWDGATLASALSSAKRLAEEQFVS